MHGSDVPNNDSSEMDRGNDVDGDANKASNEKKIKLEEAEYELELLKN